MAPAILWAVGGGGGAFRVRHFGHDDNQAGRSITRLSINSGRSIELAGVGRIGKVASKPKSAPARDRPHDNSAQSGSSCAAWAAL